MESGINRLERTATLTGVVDSLRSKIIYQEYKTGDAITEAALSQEYGISRTSIRTALQALENEGIIITLANGRKQIMGVNEKYLDDLYSTRRMLECEAARQILAVRQVDFSEMAGYVSRFREISSAEESVMREERGRVNILFHRALVRMSRNRPLLKCWTTIEPMIAALVQFNSDTHGTSMHESDYVVTHSRILEMFLAQDTSVVDFIAYHAYDGPHEETISGLKAKGCL
jgi:Transcriptional regulators